MSVFIKYSPKISSLRFVLLTFIAIFIKEIIIAENPQQILIETQFEGLTLYVRPHETHEWLMETKLVAEGYGISEGSPRSTKNRHQDELLENKHFISVANCNANPRAGIAHIQTF